MKPHPIPRSMALVTTLILSTLLLAQTEGDKAKTAPLQVLQAGAISLTSPDGKITVRFELKNIDKEKGVPVYSVTYEGRPVLVESRMGFLFRDVAPIRDFEVLKQTTQTVNAVWKPIAGERETIPDHYNEVVLDLLSCKGNWKARQVNVTFRAYNEGVAFNYHFPKDYNGHVIDIIREKTQFAFSADHTTWAIYGAQSDYSYGEMLLSKLKVDEGAERPLTVKVEQNLYASISEARIADYARMKLRPSAAKRTTLEVFLDAQYNREGIAVEGEVMGTTPMTTPWRVIMIADSPGKLLEQNYIIQNLNDPCVLTDTSWIKPGKVIRSGLSTQDGKACIDFAVKRNLQYIEFDAGWYGSESNPSSDARAVEPSRQRSLNLPEVIAYGKEKGIGVILYVNHLAMEKQLDEILPLYEKWGIKGVKYGFVHIGSQYWTKWMHEAIRKAAACHLMVDIHDEFRNCGYERTYPNLMTVEGIGGNETMPTAKHNAILPFTRYLTGPGDYTPCWNHKNLKKTKPHQMALSTIYYSPWQFLYWYSEPKNVPDEPALDYWDQLPVTWDETRVLQGIIGKRVVIARRKGSTWFVGAIAPVDGKFNMALNFLSSDKKYTAKIFSDQPGSTDVSIVEKKVDAQSSVDVDIPANSGVAIRISPLVAAEPGPTAAVPQRLNEAELPANAIWVDSMDLKHITTVGSTVMACKTVRGKPIKIDEFVYPHGLGLIGYTLIRFDLKRAATKFLADVGLEGPSSFVYAQLYVDGKKVDEKCPRLNPKESSSPIIYQLSADLKGASELVVVFATTGFSYSLGGARILLDPNAKERPTIVPLPDEQAKLMGDPDKVVWVQQMNSKYISSGDGNGAGIMCTPAFQPLVHGGKIHGNGYAVYPRSRLPIDLKGNATRFFAQVGVADSTSPLVKEGAQFKVFIDKKVAYDSGVMRAGDALKSIDLDLTGAKDLLLAVDGGDAIKKSFPVAAWVGPRILVSDVAKNPKDLKSRPEAKLADQVPMAIAAIVDEPQPAIHGPRVAGASPGRPFFFVIPATGKKPLKFTSTALPSGLTLDPATGYITGKMASPLQNVATITVSNAHGQASRPLTIICAPYGMALTPPMGWNHWNQWAMSVTGERVREAADVLVSKGFAAHGYIYVNLDEGWQGLRAADGSITGTKKQGFGDMKALGDYIHSKGLKFGIYSSPGPICCSGRLGSRDHEQQDADTWASWGVDYLKYDRCADDGKRWKLMRECLDNTGRDIVYSTGSCRDPEAKAQLWRTTGDIRNNWQSLSSIGFIQQAGLEKLAGPGRYNDPDMLIVGDPADLRKGSGITRNEQITHLTLWSMLAAPMLLGCDLTQADDFLVSVTCNDDVLDVNQDPLVRQGTCFRKDPAMGASDMGGEVWTRPLFDGTKAVAFFNRGSEPVEIAVTWKELGFTGPQPVRDCWQRKDLGSFDTGFSVRVEVHAAVLIKVGKPTTDRYEPVSR